MTAGGPQFRATPRNPDLPRWVGIRVSFVIAWLIGLVARRLPGPRAHDAISASAHLTGPGALWGGLLSLAGFSSADMWRPR